MSFTTPRPDMTNRHPERTTFGGSRKKTGRRSNGEPQRIRTIAWFNAVAISLGEQRPGAIGRRMQSEADARSLDVNHSTSKRWNHYAKGEETPNAQTLDFVDEVIPGTADIFLHGPGDLWTALWQEHNPRPDEDDITALFSVDPVEIDVAWLRRAIIFWRNRAAAIQFGAFDHLFDGFYEAVFFGLHQQEIKSNLIKLGVWESVCKNVMDSETRNLREDPKKCKEIEAIGRQFSDNPVKFYLSNPIDFIMAALETKRVKPSQ